MTREDIDEQIVRILIEDGPDGHCDGHEQITDFVMTLLPAVSYMPVPRCETCAHWEGLGPVALRCSVLRVETLGDFGCVQHKDKS